MMDGVCSPGKESRRYLEDVNPYLAVLVLAAGGALAVAVQQAFRVPLHLPGHHGLEWMAILVMARSSTRFRLGGAITGTGAAACSLLPFWGHAGDPFGWLIWLLPGLVMDAGFALLPGRRQRVSFLMVMAALAYGTKPLTRWVVEVATGWPYGSLYSGLGYPLAAHLFFGALGGLAGALLALAVFRRR